MPFINQEERKAITRMVDCSAPGQKCYWFYKDMMLRWRGNPRWTTADAIYARVKDVEPNPDWQRAKELAWQVFFNLHVVDYERQKRDLNGDI